MCTCLPAVSTCCVYLHLSTFTFVYLYLPELSLSDVSTGLPVLCLCASACISLSTCVYLHIPAFTCLLLAAICNYPSTCIYLRLPVSTCIYLPSCVYLRLTVLSVSAFFKNIFTCVTDLRWLQQFWQLEASFMWTINKPLSPLGTNYWLMNRSFLMFQTMSCRSAYQRLCVAWRLAGTVSKKSISGSPAMTSALPSVK